MPTINTDAYMSVSHELADRHYMEEEGSIGNTGLNKVGLRSHTPAPNDGRYGYHIEGIRSPAGQTTLSEFFLSTEGYHIRTPSWVFKPDIPQGAIIDSAIFKATPAGQGGNTHVQGFIKFRLYGVLEPDYIPRQMDYSSVYDQTAKLEHWWQFGYARMYRVDSFENHKRHTEECVRWQWTDTFLSTTNTLTDIPPDGATGSLATVIQEIINQPKWKPKNRLCLIMCLDKNMPGDVPPWQPNNSQPNKTGGTTGGYFDSGTINMPVGGYNANTPKLVVTYH